MSAPNRQYQIMYVENLFYFDFFGTCGIGIYFSSRSEFARRNRRRLKISEIKTIPTKSAILLGTPTVSGIKDKSCKVRNILEMVASYEKKTTQSSLELPLKRLRFWYNNRLLAPYGCSEFIFVSGAGPGVRTVTLE